jgi:hypothetical protein
MISWVAMSTAELNCGKGLERGRHHLNQHGSDRQRASGFVNLLFVLLPEQIQLREIGPIVLRHMGNGGPCQSQVFRSLAANTGHGLAFDFPPPTEIRQRNLFGPTRRSDLRDNLPGVRFHVLIADASPRPTTNNLVDCHPQFARKTTNRRRGRSRWAAVIDCRVRRRCRRGTADLNDLTTRTTGRCWARSAGLPFSRRITRRRRWY